jgi:capsular exopolysaccharide synthesis family protein
MIRPPVYEAKFSLLVEPVTSGTELGQGLKGLEQVTGGRSAETLDYDSQILVLQSESVLDPILEKLRVRYPELTYEDLTDKLNIERVDKESKLLSITYSGIDQGEVRYVTDVIRDAFVEYSVADRQRSLRSSLEKVAGEIEKQRQEVSNSEAALEDFQKRYNLVDTTQARADITSRINETLSQQQNNQVELSASVARYRALQDQIGLSPTEAVTIANLSEAPVYQKLLKDLRDIESQIALETARFQTTTPMVEALQDKREKLVPLLEAEANRILGPALAAQLDIDAQSAGFQGTVGRDLVTEMVKTANEIQVLQNRDSALIASVESLGVNLENLSSLARRYNEIQRELTLAESGLQRLLASYQDLDLEMVRQTSPWQVTSRSGEITADPIKSSWLRQLVLRTFVSLILGVGTAFLLEKLDRGYHESESITNDLKLPCLATVPLMEKESEERQLFVSVALATSMAELAAQTQEQKGKSPSSRSARQRRGSGSRSHYYGYYNQPFEEAFYGLEANLRLLNADSPIQVITISSSIPGEGKSTVSSHLAVAASKVGRRVLLVDLDSRAPVDHTFFNLSNRFGMTDLLTSDAAPEKAIQSLDDNPNLFILTAGSRSPAPTRLLSSQKFEVLIKTFRRQFDLIILDTPPLYNFADAKLACRHADGFLLTVRLNKSSRDVIHNVVRDFLTTTQTPILGFVANGVERSSSNYYYYSSYYSKNQPTSVDA